jgi:hypothetical protein
MTQHGAEIAESARFFSSLLGGKNGVGPGEKRHVSASARAKMAKAQKARWAKIRATKKKA